ncbi:MULTISPECIES: type VI secretion system contractile sheath small subunit [unclassified Pseudoalteromonas]|jgi:type VI secretion system protein ImpB|uniref:type VI secretion system contractile sheath small subunit n=1 Tax=unclassified Pseudoalteromonas TaxID=194690 RepID=UPI002359F4D9|nr:MULTISPECIES: type VI secretion system contractile sheath small subunit [unclassified Pseudoalteromonas]MDC9501605.1 type VI secretion system contractile sheath small subunit [Pseudoalteromonas sp. Angola-18]MDC9530717.1 type VI secretion system contractile sheath small subunit [Pseudoalteromonas sp. Angola-7]
MSDTFQKEIPRARINISLELDTDGASQKSELPLKMLVIGDYSNGQNSQELAERERVTINKNNIEQVLKDMAPKANFQVSNKIKGDGEINVNLEFDSFKSFDPESVAAQVPELNKMMAMRNLLRDLKSNLLDNSSLRKELERVLQNQPELDELKAKLDEIAPLASEDEKQPVTK